MKILKFIFILSVFFVAASCSTKENHKTQIKNEQNKFLILAYYVPGKYPADKLPLDKMNGIYFSFAHIKDGLATLKGFTWHHDGKDHKIDDSTKQLKDLVAMKRKFPDLKVYISIGGWGWGKDFHEMARTDKGMKAFIDSVIKIVEDYDLDGVDMDWEFPGIEADTKDGWSRDDIPRFTKLIEDTRISLDKLSKKTGKKYWLSFAAGAFVDCINNSIDWKAVLPYVDSINLMTYDFVGGYSKVTGNHSSVFPTDEQKLSLVYTLNLLESKGVPSDKIICGAAFYGRAWKDVPDINNGLYQKGTPYMPWVDYKDFPENFNSDKGFKKYWDKRSYSSYLYNRKKRIFVSYDSEKSIIKKVEYLKEHGVLGILYWELSADNKEFQLTNAVHDAGLSN